MILYAESSAVLVWLLEEKAGREIGQLLAGANQVVASDLTLLECERAIVRGVTTTQISKVHRVANHWSFIGLGREVLDRARRPFPVEPIRALTHST